MKANQKVLLLVCSFLMVSTFSCRNKEKDTINTLIANKQDVNTWIYDMMSDGYFWTEQMPARTATAPTQASDIYFENLIYQRQTHDRFSMLTDDIDGLQKQFNGVTKALGIHYVLTYIDEGKSNIAAFLSHVSKDSPADAAGLKRGDIITRVNGTTLTKDNYQQLMGGSETMQINLGRLNNNHVETDQSKSIKLTKTVITENPVAFSSIISKQNIKIGYLVYTQFVPGTDADEKKYDNQLRSIFADFKAAGVNELVLDLRLNGGGYMTSAVTLASLIVPNYTASKVFYKEQWNEKYNQYWKTKNGNDALTYKFKSEAGNIGNRLQRLFVLTSQGTASASELIINGLRPHMQVITVGDHTAGKNLFGSLIGDEKNRWKYGIYMMLGQTVNANDDSDYGTTAGIAANREVEDGILPFIPFGNERETLLQAALKEMGVQVDQTARIATFKGAKPITPSAIRDTPVAWDQLMIRDGSIHIDK